MSTTARIEIKDAEAVVMRPYDGHPINVLETIYDMWQDYKAYKRTYGVDVAEMIPDHYVMRLLRIGRNVLSADSAEAANVDCRYEYEVHLKTNYVCVCSGGNRVPIFAGRIDRAYALTQDDWNNAEDGAAEEKHRMLEEGIY